MNVLAARQDGHPEYLFAALLAVFGVAFAFGMPPVQTPDEPSHFHRSYQVSEGILFPYPVGEWGGGATPESILTVSQGFNGLIFRPDQHTTMEPFRALHAMPLNPEQRREVPFPGGSFYTFVPYLPQAFGIAVARAAGCGPLGLLYAGRLTNLALGVVLVFFAVRIIPIFKLVLGTVALIPIAVQQFASLNPDGSALPVGLLFCAVLLRWAVGRDRPIGKRDVVLLVTLAAWLTLCKFPYSLLALLYLAVPWQRLGSPRGYLAVGATLFVVAFGLAVIASQLKNKTPDRLVPDGQGASIALQTRYIARHPLRYTKILAHTAAEHSKVYLDQCSTLGWLDTPVNPLAMYFYWTVLILVALGDRAGPAAPSWRLVLCGLATAILTISLIVTLCYVVGSPVGADIVNGPQGRYFLPVAIFLLLPFHQRVVEVEVNRRLLVTLCGGTCSSVLIVALANIIGRYYFPVEEHGVFSMVGVGIGGVLFIITAAWAWWRWRPVEGEAEARILAGRFACQDRGVPVSLELADAPLLGPSP
jgi:uncharacterized membrane protein